MKSSDIVEGGSYEISLQPLQIEGLPSGGDSLFNDPGIVARGLIYDIRREDRSFGGIRAEVVGFEGEGSQKKVRVRCVAHPSRMKEYVEDNYDGTRTEWRGFVVDENDDPVRDEHEFEALIAPQQVKREWTEALVEREVRQLDWRWERMGRERMGEP